MCYSASELVHLFIYLHVLYLCTLKPKLPYTHVLCFKIVRNISTDTEHKNSAVEDLNLHGIESLSGVQYLAIGKHLCGPATGDSI